MLRIDTLKRRQATMNQGGRTKKQRAIMHARAQLLSWRGTALHVLLGLMVLSLSACAKFSSQQGVDNLWRAEDAVQFQVGRTTQSDVLEALGPPSQIISLNDGSVFYYLREYKSGAATVFIVYNEAHMDVLYDRAVFFFDRDGKLTQHSYSTEEAPR